MTNSTIYKTAKLYNSLTDIRVRRFKDTMYNIVCHKYAKIQGVVVSNIHHRVNRVVWHHVQDQIEDMCENELV